jgi:hypothetical protein
MTTTETTTETELCGSCTREQIKAEYGENYPLLREYWAVLAEFAGPRVSINTPSSSGLDMRTAASLALLRIGREARDDTDVDHAVAFIDKLESEIEARLPDKEPTVREVVIAELFGYAACVPSAADWQSDAWPQEDRDDVLADIVDRIQTDDLRQLLREALGYAMPAVLAHITAEDAKA